MSMNRSWKDVLHDEQMEEFFYGDPAMPMFPENFNWNALFRVDFIRELFNPIFEKDDVKTLVEACGAANVNLDDMYNTQEGTLCHMACAKCAPQCLSMLIHMGANLHRDLYGDMPFLLQVALSHSTFDQRCLQILLSHGLDANEDLSGIPPALDGNVETPFDWAANRNHVSTCELLYEYGGRGKHSMCKRIEDARRDCRRLSIVMAALTKKSTLPCIRKNDRNVLRLVAKHVWSFRCSDVYRPMVGPIKDETGNNIGEWEDVD